MKISFASISEAGPRKVNEDSLDCWVSASGETDACIADGLGGMGGGDVASKLAVRTFRNHLQRFGICEETLLGGAREAHLKIREAQSAVQTHNRMATTFTAVSLSKKGILGVHCGDSRAAIARRNGIKWLTKDHSEGQRLFEMGKLTKEELATYQRKHILESALGDKEDPRVDSFSFDLVPGDHVLLTTDGVHNSVLLREMQYLSSISPNPDELAKRVANSIEQHGPSDNYSMVALYVE